jgi:hypothetical protein
VAHIIHLFPDKKQTDQQSTEITGSTINHA